MTDKPKITLVVGPKCQELLCGCNLLSGLDFDSMDEANILPIHNEDEIGFDCDCYLSYSGSSFIIMPAPIYAVEKSHLSIKSIVESIKRFLGIGWTHYKVERKAE